jgi:hypothetical protein
MRSTLGKVYPLDSALGRVPDAVLLALALAALVRFVMLESPTSV